MKVEGRNPVIETLRSAKTITKLYIQNNINIDPKIREILSIAKSRNINIQWVSKDILDRLSNTQSHQGVIAETQQGHIPTLVELIDYKKLTKFIYIREANHTYNIGAIIRSAECAGYTAVILPPKIKMSSDIVRASMGASEHIPVINYSLFQLVKELKAVNFKIYGIERSHTAVNYAQADYSENFMLIIGGEDKSLTPEIFEKCDKTLMIPMYGKVNSLNMSVAAAIVIFKSIETYK